MIAPLILMLAAGPAADTFEQAKEAFRAGVSALDAGQPADAVQQFRLSLSLRESPAAWFNLGMSCSQIKDHVCVVTALEKYLSSDGAESSDELQAALSASTREIARIFVDVEGPFESVSIDGKLACNKTPCPKIVTPGAHEIEVRRAMPLAPLRESIVVAAGKVARISMSEPPPPPVATVPPPAAPPKVVAPDTAHTTDVKDGGGPPWWVWAGAGGVAVAAIVAGIVVAARPGVDGGSLDVVLELERMP